MKVQSDRKLRASRNADLLEQKSCSSVGRVVSQFDALIALANSNALAYMVIIYDCEIIFALTCSSDCFSTCFEVIFGAA